jgi:hypothetical protein
MGAQLHALGGHGLGRLRAAEGILARHLSHEAQASSSTMMALMLPCGTHGLVLMALAGPPSLPVQPRPPGRARLGLCFALSSAHGMHAPPQTESQCGSAQGI